MLRTVTFSTRVKVSVTYSKLVEEVITKSIELYSESEYYDMFSTCEAVV